MKKVFGFVAFMVLVAAMSIHSFAAAWVVNIEETRKNLLRDIVENSGWLYEEGFSIYTTETLLTIVSLEEDGESVVVDIENARYMDNTDENWQEVSSSEIDDYWVVVRG